MRIETKATRKKRLLLGADSGADGFCAGERGGTSGRCCGAGGEVVRIGTSEDDGFVPVDGFAEQDAVPEALRRQCGRRASGIRCRMDPRFRARIFWGFLMLGNDRFLWGTLLQQRTGGTAVMTTIKSGSISPNSTGLLEPQAPHGELPPNSSHSRAIPETVVHTTPLRTLPLQEL